MPIFDYICKDCGLKQEILLLYSTNRVVCEGCGGEDLEKLFPNSFSFKMGFAWPSQRIARVLDHKRVI